MAVKRTTTPILLSALFGSLVIGCAEEPAQPVSDPPAAAQSAPKMLAEPTPGRSIDPDRPAVPAIPSISIGADSSPVADGTEQANQLPQDPAEQRRELLAAMMPLQVMLGQWRGTTQRNVGEFKATDEPEWIWDFQTNRDQPEMVMTSEGNPYYEEVRLTYLTDEDKFRMTLKDPESNVRTFVGHFEQEPEEFQGDDQKTHLKYKLQLEQTDAESKRDEWQVTFNQQENNRYLVELAKRRGSNFQRFDTVATQRQGTSFAKSDTDYGQKECIISGGLGTIQVTHAGKSYWVCCTGCKAAFEEDPESWLAEYAKKQAAKEG